MNRLSEATTGDEPGRRRRGRPPVAARRVALLELAAAMFAKQGYHGTSIRDIADRAGMNCATLYHYFRSKDEALFEICLAGAEGSAERIARAMRERTAMAPRLRQIVQDNLADLAAHGDFRHVYFQQHLHLNPRQSAAIAAVSRRVRHHLDSLFAEAIAAGELPADMEPRAATLIFAALLRSISQFHVDGTARDRPAILDALSESTIRGLLMLKFDRDAVPPQPV